MTHNKHLLLNWAFLLSLVVLLLNDHYWKWTYSNYLTGKLSDFAGMLLLPLLLAYFLSVRWQKWAVYISAFFFIFWKSPYSEKLIVLYNQLAPIPINRVVDYSDLMALAMLPLAAYLIRHIHRHSFLQLPKPFLSVSSMVFITVCAFVATSPPYSYYYSYNHEQGNVRFYGTDYSLKMSKTAILQKLQNLGFQVAVDSTVIQNMEKNWRLSSDTLVFGLADYYKIEELIVDEDTLKDIQFSLRSLSESKTTFYLNALSTTAAVDSIQVEIELRKIYQKIVKKEVIRALKRE